MVYGNTVRIPGDMFDNPPIDGNTHDFVHNLRERVQQMIPKATTNNSKCKTFVSKDLRTCTHVFVKHGQPLKKLSPCYDGPFEVISRNDKTFNIMVIGKPSEVSIDRIKPAYHVEDQPSTNDRFLKSGHHVRYRSVRRGSRCSDMVYDRRR